ncbi:YafY family transcriptional regulator [Methylobacterium sp. J-030]|uniref:helix-turn-helix transcriptional regulator n=1 Tax=Methylobacterium sp. J-030 TaxID=2836627 RepID=UPI001FB9E529|nr:YafY family protein [Methylobacterium sp. J-030]MCJ2074014.1 YafY family transcriptional regulator [Methylobacterium sp. J-030]
MARSDRLFRLLHAMRVMPPPLTARRLAEETGMSVRSLYRDIDSLRAAGARIEGERGYGYRLTEDVALPPQTFDRLEIEALAIGMAAVGAMGDPDLARASASVLAKVAATLTDERERHLLHAVSKVYRPEARHAATPDTALIRDACWREERLTLHYTDEHGADTERTILPLAIVYTERRSVVLAWCQLRAAFRMFRLDRIRDARTGAGSFRPRRASLLRAYLEQLRQEDASPATSHGPHDR